MADKNTHTLTEVWVNALPIWPYMLEIMAFTKSTRNKSTNGEVIQINTSRKIFNLFLGAEIGLSFVAITVFASLVVLLTFFFSFGKSNGDVGSPCWSQEI